MSNGYDAPREVRELEKMLTEFTYHNGLDISQVFDHWLEYIIWGFSLDGKPIENWKYKGDENKFFYDLMCEWIKVMDKEVCDDTDWYDAFGDLYMACIASKSRAQVKGQFFTPTDLCDMIAENIAANIINPVKKKPGQTCNDPTCGSGRTLLAWHVRNPGTYLFGEDIDRTCCLMSVCNFLIHGCVGEIIWHNSLDPGSYYYGWCVNASLNKPYHPLNGIPHVRSIAKEESFVWNLWENRRIQVEQERMQASIIKAPEEKKTIIQETEIIQQATKLKPIQLNLFD